MTSKTRVDLPQSDWRWYGMAAHFIGAPNCMFHLATEIGGYMISSVGDYHPFGKDGKFGKRETIGCGRTYETFVFFTNGGRCECGCGMPSIDLSEIDSLPANDAITATENHMAMCEKYAALSTLDADGMGG